MQSFATPPPKPNPRGESLTANSGIRDRVCAGGRSLSSQTTVRASNVGAATTVSVVTPPSHVVTTTRRSFTRGKMADGSNEGSNRSATSRPPRTAEQQRQREEQLRELLSRRAEQETQVLEQQQALERLRSEQQRLRSEQ
jgi:hypothetical protein